MEGTVFFETILHDANFKNADISGQVGQSVYEDSLWLFDLSHLELQEELMSELETFILHIQDMKQNGNDVHISFIVYNINMHSNISFDLGFGFLGLFISKK